MNNHTKEFQKQMGNDELDGEITDKELVLEFLKFSALPPLYMTEDSQRDNYFYRRAVKIIGIATARNVFDV